MSIPELVLVTAGLWAAGLVKGLTGIGYTTCALPFLVAAVGLQSAMAIVIAPAIASNAAVIAGSAGLVSVARRFGLFYGGIIPGIAAGVIALTHIDTGLATRLLGWITLGYVGLALARPDVHLPAVLERPLALPAGLVNGFLTGLTGSQILPLMPFMMALRLPPDLQVQAVNLAVTIASAVLALTLIGTGVMTAELLVVSVAGIVPAVIGVAAGNVLRRRLEPGLFKTLTLLTLAAMGVAMAGRVG